MPARADDPEVEEYRVALEVSFAEESWTGTVEFEVLPVSHRLSLDSDQLDIRSVEVDGRPTPFEVEPAEQRLDIDLPGAPRGRHVRVQFAGRVDRRQMLGLYRSRAGTAYVLTSQCGATGARRIFPCLDRPDRRARIALRVTTELDQEVISNMPPTSVERVDDRRRWEFPPTPAMATYLFYLGIGRFERRAGPPGDRVPLSVCASPPVGDSAAFALSVGGRLLRFFEEYYGIPYPLPKMDLVAVAEHGWGAMENWGAITFRDMRLLVDASSSESDRRLAFITIAHELAHQWFGNLVTMRWWDDVWLNESFASLLSYKAVDRLDPSLRAFDDYLVIDPGRALPVDSLASTASIVQPVERAEEIISVFDPQISYGKGASVLRMIEAYLGEEVFRRGVTLYLKVHAGGNAETRDLWAALEAESGEPVPALLGPWVERPGLPVVEVRSTPHGLALAQRRFFTTGRREGGVWPIPLVLDIDGRPHRQAFAEASATLAVPAGATVHLNPGATGFYRVLYDATLYDRLLRDFGRRPMADRWSVLGDLHAFLLSGDVDWATYARFVRETFASPEYPLVFLIGTQLRELCDWAPDAPEVVDLARSFYAEQFRRIGPRTVPGELAGTGTLRESIAVHRAAVDEGFARELAELFPEWNRIDPDLRKAVALARARAEPSLAFAEIRRRLAQHPPEGEAWRLELALGWLSEPEDVQAVMDGCLRGEVNKGHVWTVLLETARNPAARATSWAWAREHLPEVDAAFRGTMFLAELLRPAIPRWGLGVPSGQVRPYFDAHRFPEGARGVAQGLEMLTIAEEFRARIGARASA